MTGQQELSPPAARGPHRNQLLRDSIKFFHIVLMVTAAAAPLVVASAYIPISVATGAGMSVPVTFAGATVILVIFTIGYAEMAKRITAAGAFYTFTTQGLGRPMGLAAGFLITAAYSMISAAIGGGFGVYLSRLLGTYLGLSVPWYWCSIAGLLGMAAISHFRVTITARILGILLGLEVLIVLVVDFFILGQGGQSGIPWGSLLPHAWLGAPAIGIGFFLAFWSWIGFETTAIYSEETVDPKQSVPRATYISVISLGVFYTLTAFAAVAAFGNNAPAVAQKILGEYFFKAAGAFAPTVTVHIMDVLVVSGFFACSFSFHNNASRYFYSLGRDGLLPKFLGKTHRVHRSPYVAILVQVAIAITTVTIFAVGGAEPLLHLGTWLPIFCTLAVLSVQLLVSLGVIGYFNRVGRDGIPGVTKTLVAPLLGAVSQGVIIYLLVTNITFLAESAVLVVVLIPLYVFTIACIGVVYALVLQRRGSERYQAIGQLRDEDFVEVVPD